jgi:hypothetical protein
VLAVLAAVTFGVAVLAFRSMDLGPIQ